MPRSRVFVGSSLPKGGRVWLFPLLLLLRLRLHLLLLLLKVVHLLGWWLRHLRRLHVSEDLVIRKVRGQKLLWVARRRLEHIKVRRIVLCDVVRGRGHLCGLRQGRRLLLRLELRLLLLLLHIR